VTMRSVRTWLPVAVITAGAVLMIVGGFKDFDINWLEGGGLLISAGLSIWLLNFLYRVGVSGDRERDDEDRARDYFAEHGRWPDEEPPGR
jgi:hypothetical protein